MCSSFACNRCLICRVCSRTNQVAASRRRTAPHRRVPRRLRIRTRLRHPISRLCLTSSSLHSSHRLRQRSSSRGTSHLQPSCSSRRSKVAMRQQLRLSLPRLLTRLSSLMRQQSHLRLLLERVARHRALILPALFSLTMHMYTRIRCLTSRHPTTVTLPHYSSASLFRLCFHVALMLGSCLRSATVL